MTEALASAPTQVLATGLPSIGTVLAGRFELSGLLGAGGMGAVYRARDRELDEIVAVKVLLPEAAQDPDAVARFFREARLARRVTHPNVARTFDGGRDGGLPFLTMELVEGPTLRARWPEGTRPPLTEVLRIGAEIARGLAAAHAAGVVHRDLKPDNVLVERTAAAAGASLGERIVLTDFGIARAAQAAQQTQGLVGTPMYMAPEQLRGEAVDGRVDVYALGLLLHELLSGRPVFDALPSTTVARVSGRAIPPDVRTLSSDVPEPLARLITEQLSPRREDRPDAQRSLERLEAMRGAASPLDRAPQVPKLSATLLARARTQKPRTVSLAPLIAHDSGATVLAQDLSAAVGDMAAALRGVRVVPVRGDSVAELAVTGSVATEGEAVAVRLRLVDLERGTIAWAQRLTGHRNDPFGLEDEACRALQQILEANTSELLRGGPTDPKVREIYQEAREAFERFDPMSVRAAVTSLEAGLVAHPSDAWLKSLLGASLARVFLQEGARNAAMFARAEELSLRALAIDPTMARTFVTIAALRVATGEGRAALRALYEALERAPLHPRAHYALGRMLIESSLVDEGLPRVELARKLQPGLTMAHVQVAATYALMGRRADAERTLSEATAIVGELALILPNLRLCYWWADRARAAYTADLLERAGGGGAAWFAAIPILRGFAEGHPFEGAFAVFDRLASDAQAAPQHRSFMYQLAAEYHAAIGDAAAALDMLERGAVLPMIDVFWLDHCPPLALVRDDPRFLRLRAVVAARAAELWA